MSACLAGPRSSSAGSSDLTVNALFRRFGTAFAAATPLSVQQRRVLRDLQLCRTPQLGGHLERCDSCGHCHLLLHSCRNRHCPTCQSLLQKAWLEARCERIVKVRHYGLYASGNVNHRLRKALLLLPSERPAKAPTAQLLAPASDTASPPAAGGSSNKEPLLPRCPVCLRGSMVPSVSLEQVARVLCELFAALAALRKDTS